MAALPFLLTMFDAEEFARACRACDISREKLRYIFADQRTNKPLDRSLLDRLLDGQGRFDHRLYGQMPMELAREYYWEMFVKVGPPLRLRKLVACALAMTFGRKMARMALSETQNERIA